MRWTVSIEPSLVSDSSTPERVICPSSDRLGQSLPRYVGSCLFLCLKMSLFDKASNVGLFSSCAVLSKAVMGSFLEFCRPALSDLFDALSVYPWSLPLSNCQTVIGRWELVRVGAVRLVTWAVKSNETDNIRSH